MEDKLRVLKSFFALAVFLAALAFEGASRERLVWLLLLFAVFLAWGYVRPGYEKRRFWLYFVDFALIYALEYQSRYLVNYFFHSLYVITILEAGISLERRNANIVTGMGATAALVKFGADLVSRPGARTLSEFLFNLFALAFLITLLNYGRLQREETKKSASLYRELLAAYRQLEAYAARAEYTAVLEERARIAREIHDALGHRLTSVLMLLEMCGHVIEQNLAQARELLERAKQSAREGLTDTRQAVKALKEKESSGLAGIREMVDGFSRDAGLSIDWQLPEADLTPEESIVLFRAIQEALTNAVRHGEASTVQIRGEIAGQELIFCVTDNGRGGLGAEGFGLGSMRERLEKLGGQLEVTPGQRFTLTGRFPLRRYF